MENINKRYLQIVLIDIYQLYNLKDFKNIIKTQFESINNWYKTNRLSLVARSKARVCGRSLGGNVGSNSVRGMVACHL